MSSNLVAVLYESGKMPQHHIRTYRRQLGLMDFNAVYTYSEMCSLLRRSANQNYVARLSEWRSDVFIRWDENEQALVHSANGEDMFNSSSKCFMPLSHRTDWIIYKASDHAIYTAIEQQEKHKDFLMFGE